MFTPMYKCYTPCIYFHQIHNRHEKPSISIVCNYREGEEIRNIPIEEINNCKHFKTYNKIKENNKKFYQIKY